MITTNKKPVVMTFDDDNDINKAVSLFLNNIGFQTITHDRPEALLKKLETMIPDICLVDIMFNGQPVGFDIVKKIRSRLHVKVPIIVMSGNSDLFTVTHAIELGANDFIMKPIDKDLLISKISRFAASGDIVENKYPSKQIKDEDIVPSTLSIEFFATELDEFGITIQSPHVITKGTVLQVGGLLIRDITETENALMMSITNTWLIPSSQNYGAYAEFDHTNDKLMTSVRKWLSKKVA